MKHCIETITQSFQKIKQGSVYILTQAAMIQAQQVRAPVFFNRFIKPFKLVHKGLTLFSIN